jgi:hypothetical protein
MYEYSKRNNEILYKEISLESGPCENALADLPASWIPLLDLANKERYVYDQLECVLKAKANKNFDLRIGEAVKLWDGRVVWLTGTRRKAKYKWLMSNGYCYNTEDVIKGRERFLRECLPVEIAE